MKILIINLPRYKGSSIIREGRCEMVMDYRIDTPATLLIIASILKKIVSQIDFIDANGFNLSYRDIFEQIKNENYDLAVFTVASMIFEHDLKICNLLKKINPSCLTVGYSWYARKYSKEILDEYKNLDVLIIEDPFSVIENLVTTIYNNGNLANVGGITYRDENDQIKITPKIKSKIKFDDLPLPAYDLLPSFKPYYIYTPFLKPYALVYAGKGCPFGCKYCNVANTKYSGRSAENILKELKILRKIGNVKYVWFFDEIFTLNKKKVIEVCNGIIKEKIKIKWMCDSRVDLVDIQLLKLMRKAGCIGISYGVESASQKILNLMNKGITVKQARNALKWTRKAHIPSQLNLILGYIGENENTLKETEFFIKSTLPEFLQITKMTALADTEFARLAYEKGWLSENSDWKQNLIIRSKILKNYQPYSLNIGKEMRKMHKILYYNPKWWITSFITLINNPILIPPVIGTFIKRMFDKKIL